MVDDGRAGWRRLVFAHFGLRGGGWYKRKERGLLGGDVGANEGSAEGREAATGVCGSG
jgi:hypothetical protein